MPHLAASRESDVLSVLPGMFPLSKLTGRRLDSEKVFVGTANWLRLPTALSDAQMRQLFRQEIGASIICALDFEIQRIDELYIFRRPEVVRSFIQEHPFLAPLLKEAYAEIENYFGPYPQVFLEVISDPEATDDRQLFAFIGTHLSPDEALNTLERFDEEWWLDRLDEGQGVLCIDVEFL